MNYIIKIENLNFKYKNNEIFKNLNLTIKENSFTTILGANGSGKTTLVKLLLGKEQYNGKIVIDKMLVVKENLKHIHRITSKIVENSAFTSSTVLEELNNSLQKASFIGKQFKTNIEQVNKLLKLNDLLEKDPNALNDNDKTLVTIATALITKPKILIIDETLNNLNEPTKIKVLKLLQKMVKNKELTVVYMTHNSDDSLYSDNIIILDNTKVLVSGKKEKVYINEKNFETAGLELPFIINLSKKLQFYNLINKDYQSAEKMVEQLWK